MVLKTIRKMAIKLRKYHIWKNENQTPGEKKRNDNII